MPDASRGLQVDRRFVRIEEGQVHLREAGSGDRVLWMLHASPASSVSLVPLIERLGARRRVLAPDTLGNGDSAPAGPAVPDIAYYAGSSLRVMDALGVERADVYGSHTGAHIAIEMAIARPDRVRSIILDGIAMFTPEERRDYLAHYAPAVEPDAIGSQLHWAWHFVRDQGWFFPYFRRDAAHNRRLAAPSAEALHRTTVEVLKAIRTYHHAYRAAFAHDDRGRLPLVKVPVFCLADAEDPLSRGVPEAAALVPGGARQCVLPPAADPRAHLDLKCATMLEFLDAQPA